MLSTAKSKHLFKLSVNPGPGTYKIYKEPKSKTKKNTYSVFKSKTDKDKRARNNTYDTGPGNYFKLF